MAEEGGKSVRWMVVALMLAVLALGWATAAAFYFQESGEVAGERANFFVNAVQQLPNFGSVVAFTFRRYLWLVIVVVVLEVLVLLFGRLAAKLDQELYGGKSRRK